MSEINLIRSIIDAMPERPAGSEREFMLSFRPGYGWKAGVWNPTTVVGLGEAEPRYSGEGKTIGAALDALIADLSDDGFTINWVPTSE